jgi:predicted amidohydrolase YtcJ
MGLTGLHDFDRRRCFSALQILRQQGRLTLRVVKSIPLEDLPYAAAIGLRTGFGDDFLRIGGVKAFADGALGPRTAAMLQPYEGEPDNRGMLLLDAEELYEHGRRAVNAGFSMAVHAIGDRAVHEVLNAFTQLRQYERETQGTNFAFRHRIEHVQVIHPEDASRLGALGIIASMQPVHAPSDMRMADRFWGDRAALAYAWRTQLDNGATLALGSDAPVESPNPFWGLHAAVTRQQLDGSPGPDGWYPAQKLTLKETLRGFTYGPAYTANVDDRMGKLAPGYLADLLVLDQDPFHCEPEAIKEIRPLMTMLGGEWVYREISA